MTRVWGRAPEKRQGISRLLAQAAELVQQRSAGNLLRSRLERDVGYLLRARSVSIREAQGPSRPSAIREGPGVVLAPLPGFSDPALVLEIRPDHHGLDAWAQQVLADVVRIVSLALSVGTNAPTEKGKASASGKAPQSELIGRSPEMARLRHEIGRMAGTDFIVLVEGESGSGKELVARLIHEQSSRRDGLFVGVNCAALVETLLEAELFGIEDRTATGVRGRRGKFELADGGTLFLDEVADLSPAAQAKLLRVIQERSVERVGGHATRVVDTRIVVATNQGLRGLSEDGRFRTDLFYRLSGVEIHVPPLRARRGDIPILVEHFLERHRTLSNISVSASALDALKTYDWPGNVRELERVVERAVTLTTSTRIELTDLPTRVTGAFVGVLEPSLHENHTMRAWGSRYARLMLERCGNNKRRTCQALGISYHTLQAYLHYGHSAERDESSTQHAMRDPDRLSETECHEDRSSGLIGEQGRRFLP